MSELREFIKLEDLTNRVRTSPFFERQFNEDLKKDNGFIIFDTPTQKTWLIISNQYLYCVLDDVKNEKLILKFRINLSSLFANQVDLLNFENLDEDISKRVIDIRTDPIGLWGNQYGKVWFPGVNERYYFSLRLFPSKEALIMRIKKYIQRALEKGENNAAAQLI